MSMTTVGAALNIDPSVIQELKNAQTAIDGLARVTENYINNTAPRFTTALTQMAMQADTVVGSLAMGFREAVPNAMNEMLAKMRSAVSTATSMSGDMGKAFSSAMSAPSTSGPTRTAADISEIVAALSRMPGVATESANALSALDGQITRLIGPLTEAASSIRKFAESQTTMSKADVTQVLFDSTMGKVDKLKGNLVALLDLYSRVSQARFVPGQSDVQVETLRTRLDALRKAISETLQAESGKKSGGWTSNFGQEAQKIEDVTARIRASLQQQIDLQQRVLTSAQTALNGEKTALAGLEKELARNISLRQGLLNTGRPMEHKHVKEYTATIDALNQKITLTKANIATMTANTDRFRQNISNLSSAMNQPFSTNTIPAFREELRKMSQENLTNIIRQLEHMKAQLGRRADGSYSEQFKNIEAYIKAANAELDRTKALMSDVNKAKYNWEGDMTKMTNIGMNPNSIKQLEELKALHAALRREISKSGDMTSAETQRAVTAYRNVGAAVKRYEDGLRGVRQKVVELTGANRSFETISNSISGAKASATSLAADFADLVSKMRSMELMKVWGPEWLQGIQYVKDAVYEFEIWKQRILDTNTALQGSLDKMALLQRETAQQGNAAMGRWNNGNGANAMLASISDKTTTVEKLRQDLSDIQTILSKTPKFDSLGNVTQEWAKLSEMERLATDRLKEYEREKSSTKKTYTATEALELGKNAKSYNELKEAIKALKQVMNGLDPKQAEWTRLNSELRRCEASFSNIKNKMRELKIHTQSATGSMSQLKTMIAQAFSIQAVYGWIKKMVEVHAQMQLQKVALRAIIQNKDEADRIFGQVQQMALQSPFTIMQLTTFTKQLAAYRIEASKLVETTKMLADVSAGLGVDMQRLILAYGQVKSANYLRATEVRQFTEAGLNIAGELANLYTEQKNKLVSVADVMEMITKRMVKFEDVAEVFKRVTSAGGLFYDMQKKQSESVYGQMQRIKDAFTIMLDDIGSANNSTIKTVLAGIRSLISSWRSIAPYIKGALAYAAAFYSTKGILAMVASLKNLVTMWHATETAAKGAMIATEATTKAAKAAMATNLIGWAAAAIVVVASLINQTDRLDDRLKDIRKEAEVSASTSIFKFKELIKVVTDVTTSYTAQQEALEEIRRSYKGIFTEEELQIENIRKLGEEWDKTRERMLEYYSAELDKKMKETVIEEGAATRQELINTISGRELFDGYEGYSEAVVQSILKQMMREIDEGEILNGGDVTGMDIAKEFFKRLSEYYSEAADLDEVFDDIKASAEWMSDWYAVKLDAALPMIADALGNGEYGGGGERGQYIRIAADLKELCNEAEKTKSRITDLNTAIAGVGTNGKQFVINQEIQAIGENLEKVKSQMGELYSINLAGGFADTLEESSQEVKGLVADIKKEVAAYSLFPDDVVFDKIKDAVQDSFTLKKNLMSLSKAEYGILKESGPETARKELEEATEEFKKYLTELYGAVPSEDVMQEYARRNPYFQGRPDLAEDYEKATRALAGYRKEAEKMFAVFDDLDKQNQTTEMQDNLYDLMDVVAQLHGMSRQVFDGISWDSPSQAAKDLNAKYEENKNTLDQITKIKETQVDLDTQQFLIRALLNAETDEDAEREIARLKEVQEIYKHYANAIGYDIKDKDKKKGGKGKDPWQERLQLMKKVNSEYEKLLKHYDEEESKRRIAESFGDAAKEVFKGVGKWSDINNWVGFDKAQTVANLREVLNSGLKITQDCRKKIQEEIGVLQAEIDIKVQEESLERLKNDVEEVFDRFELTKTFLDLGVNENLMDRLFGKAPVRDLKQLKEEFEKLAVTAKAENLFGEDYDKWYADRLKKITDLELKQMQEQTKNYIKYTKEAMSERGKIVMEAFQERNRIEQDNNLNEATKSLALAQNAQKMREALAKQDWEDFKNSEMYVQMFENLEYASTASIRRMRTELEGLKDSWKNLPADQLKAIVKEVEKLDDQLRERNPFGAYIKSLKAVTDLRKQGITLEETERRLAEVSGKQSAIKQEITDLETAKAALVGNVNLADIEEEKRQKILILMNLGGDAIDRMIAKEKNKLKSVESQKAEIERMNNLFAEFGKDTEKTIEFLNEMAEKVKSAKEQVMKLVVAAGGSEDSLASVFADATIELVQMGFQIFLLSLKMKELGAAAKSAMAIVGYILIALEAVTSVIVTIMGAGDKIKAKRIKELKDQVDALSSAYENLKDKISEAYKINDYKSGVDQGAENIKRRIEAYEHMLALEQAKKKTDKEAIKEYRAAIQDLKKELDDLANEQTKSLGGFGKDGRNDAASQFVDAWLSAFKETGDGLDALGEQWDSYIEGLLKKQAAYRLVGARMEKFFNQIDATANANSEKSMREILDQIREIEGDVLSKANEELKEFFDYFGWTSDGNLLLSDLQKGIQNITEEQAAALESITNSIRFGVYRQVDILESILGAVTNQYSSVSSPLLSEVKSIRALVGNIDRTLNSVVRTHGGPDGKPYVRVN